MLEIAEQSLQELQKPPIIRENFGMTKSTEEALPNEMTNIPERIYQRISDPETRSDTPEYVGWDK